MQQRGRGGECLSTEVAPVALPGHKFKAERTIPRPLASKRYFATVRISFSKIQFLIPRNSKPPSRPQRVPLRLLVAKMGEYHTRQG